MRDVALREEYDDGLRDTLTCGHVVYVADKRPVERRRCLLCARRKTWDARRPRRTRSK